MQLLVGDDILLTPSSGEFSLLTWEELTKKQYKDPPFLLDPYIPREGIVFLFGGSSIGKSPISWLMARCIGEGKFFFGLPTTKARVLYIDLDTPEATAAERLKIGQPGENVWFAFGQQMQVPDVPQEQLEELRMMQVDISPEVVFINTLRKVHVGDDKDSATPAKVYGFWRGIFPKAALVFIHHVKKSPADPRIQFVNQEKHSGSQAWVNDAQVALLLERWSDKTLKSNLRLYHVKSQATQRCKPLPLKLLEDGVTLESPLYFELTEAWKLFNSDEADGKTQSELATELAKRLSVSESTARRRLLEVGTGTFPGTRFFLGRDEEEDG